MKQLLRVTWPLCCFWKCCPRYPRSVVRCQLNCCQFVFSSHWLLLSAAVSGQNSPPQFFFFNLNKITCSPWCCSFRWQHCAEISFVAALFPGFAVAHCISQHSPSPLSSPSPPSSGSGSTGRCDSVTASTISAQSPTGKLRLALALICPTT